MQFLYEGINSKGNIRKGELTAKDYTDAKIKLKKMHIEIKRLTVSKRPLNEDDNDEIRTPILGNFIYRDSAGEIQISFGERNPTTKELIIFTKQLATMIVSGVPLVQSIGILAKQQQSKLFRSILKKIKKSVETGKTLSSSLNEHPKIFDSLYVAMSSAGEASGNLDTILIKLVSYIERSSKIKEQVKSALMYPLVVLLVAILVISGLLIFVVPVFATQYTDSGKELPGLTQSVIDFSNFFITYWYYIFGSMFLFVAIFQSWKNTQKGRKVFDTYILKAPVIGPVLKKITIARFCSTMASMLSSGVNLLQALGICAASSGNKMIEDFVLSVKSGLEKGEKFSEPLARGNIFPEMVISMVTVGEATGALDDMLEKVSAFYEEEVDLAVKTMLSMIEPIMIVFIGGIVAFIVVAMYLPIFDMASTID